MITSLEVVGFKRFARQIFKLSPLTILAGLNGSGKTTVVQSLLLLSEASNAKQTVKLNGPYGLELGTAIDVRNWEAGDTIEFKIACGAEESLVWKFSVPHDDAMYLNLTEGPSAPPPSLLGRPRAFSYLSAERYGPRSTQMSASISAEELEVGPMGENCAQILEVAGDRPIADSSRQHPNKTSGAAALLKYEVEQWLGEIARPVEINAVRPPGFPFTSLNFRSPGGIWVRAPNMGFGVSYALPIIVAGLIADNGGLLVVENPEAHLHPAGQSRMGVFLAWLAGRGIQVVVETHSDHILNGIRRAIAEYQYLPHTSAIANFLEDDENGLPKVAELSFTKNGGISHWPSGFFDQFQIDTASLGRIRRKG